VKFVTFYTNDFYGKHATEMVYSADCVGVCVEPIEVGGSGGWLKNTSYKARFILEEYKEALDEPLVWIDADARFRAYPQLLFDLEREGVVDVAVHKFMGWQVASGTVYFGATPRALKIINEWVRLCAENPTRLDQDMLKLAIEAVPDATVCWLPPEYCFIFDLSRKQYPGAEPVIEHLQASRVERKRNP